MDGTRSGCAQCGAAFVVKKKNRYPQIYCSKPCRQKGVELARVGRDTRYGPTLACEACGVAFRRWPKSEGRFCSRQCAGVLKRKPEHEKKKYQPRPKRPPVIATCSECGASFSAKTQAGKICSERCSNARGRRLWREGAAARGAHREVETACLECGRQIRYVRFNNARKFCGRRCTRKYNAKSNPQERHDSARRRRARLRGSAVERFAVEEIFERDGWRCQICAKSTKRIYQPTDPFSPTLDHIIPLALGGAHTRTNVQLAHLICNSRKGASEGAQLRLLG